MCASTVACLTCQRAEHAISAMPDKLCFLSCIQTCDFYNIRVLFAMDRCLLSKRRFIFILSAFLLNSEIIFNIRSIFLCATTVLTETLKKFSMAKFYLAPHKINENLMKVDEKICVKIRHNWIQYTLKIYWLQYLPSPMVECNLNPWFEFLAA